MYTSNTSAETVALLAINKNVAQEAKITSQ
jgi:hypothetical protein